MKENIFIFNLHAADCNNDLDEIYRKELQKDDRISKGLNNVKC